MNVHVRRFLMAALLALSPAGFVSADTCTCDGPCSGSITCSGGCYAYCEENPENSGRHVCVKGCASSDAGDTAGGNDSSVAGGVAIASGEACN